jgi:hypothetical protein
MFRHERDANSEHVNALEGIQNDDMLNCITKSVTEILEEDILDEEASNMTI